jgi:hypothetical protein
MAAPPRYCWKGVRFGYSRNVYIEGEPAVRHLDPLMHNHAGFSGNTPPAPWVSVMDPDVPRMPPRQLVAQVGEGKGWIGLVLVDETGLSVDCLDLTITTADGARRASHTGAAGAVEVRGIAPGKCQLVAGPWRRGGTPRRVDAEAAGEVQDRSVTLDELRKGISLETGKKWRLTLKTKAAVTVAWSTALIERLPEDVRLFFSGTERGAISARLSEGKTQGRLKRFSFHWNEVERRTTLEAVCGKRRLVLWKDQVVGRPEDVAWCGRLEDWQEREPAYELASLEVGAGEDFVALAKSAAAAKRNEELA